MVFGKLFLTNAGESMQLYILDKNTIRSAIKIPEKYRFKMLLELAQMVSSLTGSVYKPVKQGKKLVSWINHHRRYVYYYFGYLYFWGLKHIKMKQKTKEDLYSIWQSLKPLSGKLPVYAYFRYRNDYICEAVSDECLDIGECISLYEKYLKWKKEKSG